MGKPIVYEPQPAPPPDPAGDKVLEIVIRKYRLEPYEQYLDKVRARNAEWKRRNPNKPSVSARCAAEMERRWQERLRNRKRSTPTPGQGRPGVGGRPDTAVTRPRKGA